MADPRFFIKPCHEKTGGATADRRSFFNATGKVGDLEILNKSGAGSKIGQGLRTMASVSNSIRTGCGALPSSIGNTLDAGANWVLSNVGFAPSLVTALQGFNPQVANQATSQAKQIFDKVKRGNFKTSDIPGALQDFQNLERLGRNIYTPSKREQDEAFGVCGEISPYAIDLLRRAPKYKFMFVVQFIFNSAYSSLHNLDFAFVVKTSTRPNVKVVMDDVNFYNFRTKVITKTEFEEMTMTFHDDTGLGANGSSGEIGNYALRFYNAYMRATAPITNHSSAAELFGAEDRGMDFQSDSVFIESDIETARYAASRGPLSGDARNIITEIRLFHIYDFGEHMNVYKFFNPRLTNLQLDDLDMAASSEGSQVSLSFNYDSVYIDTGIPMDDLQYSVSDLTRGAIYPLRYNSSGGKPLPPRNVAPFGTPASPSGNSCDPSINTS